jgi:Protein of unknown function (DUF2778)
MEQLEHPRRWPALTGACIQFRSRPVHNSPHFTLKMPSAVANLLGTISSHSAARGWMTRIADARLPRSELVRPIAPLLAALVLATGTATWVAGIGLPGSLLSSEDEASLLDDRDPATTEPRPPSAAEIRFLIAKGLLAQGLSEGGWRTSVPDQQTAEIAAALPVRQAAGIAAAVPLPKSRPAEADLPSQDNGTAKADDRPLLQRLSELFRPRTTLASLTPEDGITRDATELTSLGYDHLTAVYDISARVVHLPNGTRLEAHSGLGNTKDDPRHVSERGVGATPPAVYDLKPRDRPFHGVQALRMIPVEGNTLGRSGLLAHGYMLGPEGDSNGCVSIKNYDRFLSAFQNGEIKRLVVVPSLTGLARSPLNS